MSNAAIPSYLEIVDFICRWHTACGVVKRYRTKSPNRNAEMRADS